MTLSLFCGSVFFIMKEREIIDPNSIVAGTPDWQEGYEQGLLAGYTKSICLVRHLQRAIVPKNARIQDLIINRRLEWEKLEEAMELIADKIEVNPIVGVDENDNDIYLSDK